MIQFIVPAVPVAQPRARATFRNGHASVYEPKTIKTSTGRQPHPIAEFKATVKHAARLAYSGAPLDVPLRVDVVFVFPRPKGLMWKRKPMPRVRHAIKPDRDNCDKALLDSLKGLVWLDDCQVCDGRIEKWIAAGDEQPHVEVTITPSDELLNLAEECDVLGRDGLALSFRQDASEIDRLTRRVAELEHELSRLQSVVGEEDHAIIEQVLQCHNRRGPRPGRPDVRA